jgi:hypothetical protein
MLCFYPKSPEWYKEAYGAGLWTSEHACTWPSLYWVLWKENHTRRLAFYTGFLRKKITRRLAFRIQPNRPIDGYTSQMTMQWSLCMHMHGAWSSTTWHEGPTDCLVVLFLPFLAMIAYRSSQRQRQLWSLHVLPGPRSIFCGQQATVYFRLENAIFAKYYSLSLANSR